MLGSHLAQLGRAALGLDQGNPLAALQSAERYLRTTSAAAKLDRVVGLELLIRAQVALGEHDRARQSLRELEAISSLVPALPLLASVRFSEGTVAVAAGDYEEARRQFEDAADLFARSGAPYETARSRLELARVLAVLGQPEAMAEASAALVALRDLGAEHDAVRAAALASQLQQTRGPRAPDAMPRPALTIREVQVLQLIARGLSDKEMAGVLGLSRHTVHRHVANILTKLDQPSRAAAVAHAAQLGLL